MSGILTGSSLREAEASITPEKAVDPAVRRWLEQLADARRREKDWRAEAKRITKLYEADSPGDNEFNILYSNTETLLPALYNNTPRPVVQRKHKDANPIGGMVSKITERTLVSLLDPGDMETSPFDTLIEQAVLEALVPGRGVTRFKYEATFERAESSPAEGEVEEVQESPQEQISERVTYESVIGEEVPYDKVLFGFAKRWKDVPWIAFEHFLTREEAIRVLGQDVGARIPLTASSKEDASEASDSSSAPENSEGVKFAHLYEIWDKTSKQVLFISPGWLTGMAKPAVPDPLELSGFFPMPQPLQFTAKVSSLVPAPLFIFYEAQAKELNRITARINKIVSALKVRGFYDANIEGMDKVLEAEDNTLVAADNAAALAQGRGLDSSIWLMPIEKLVTVLQQLYLQRGAVKQVIYEITGISDIVRGSSVASETATAQNIKNQWGTLRLKRMQKRVQVYVRRCLRLMMEIAVSKFSPETYVKMSGMNFPSRQEKLLAQQTAQQAAAIQQQPPAQVLTLLQLPTWEELLRVLQDSFTRNFLIDIETNSTVDAEATEDKQAIGEFLNAVAQFMNGAAPLVQQGILPFEAMKAMLLAIVQRYRFGSEVEEQIRQMQAPPPPQDPGQGQDGEAAAKAQAAQVDLKLKQQEGELKLHQMQQEAALKEKEMQFKLAELDRKQQLAEAKFQTALAQAKMAAMMPKGPAVSNSEAHPNATV